ncbi:hypothetical protein SDC9_93148 [bioreactor metagenome]|uniref:Uncharacterized protein n=1 Tax=bioreactor metagenome TaxID=1076179 RepID=A0A645A129_9ZZZZ
MENVVKFVYAPCDSTWDSLSCALYSVMLYASNDVCEAAQVVFDKAIGFFRSDRSSALRVDAAVNEMGMLMRNDLEYFRCSAGRG